MLSADVVPGSNTIVARWVTRLTCASFTPGTLVTAFSIRRTQAAQVIPRTPSSSVLTGGAIAARVTS